MNPEPATTVVATKPWYTSRTVWLNALGLIVLIVGVILDNAKLIDLPPESLGYLGMVLAVANALLRFITTQPLAGGPNQSAVVPSPPISTVQAPMPDVTRGPRGEFRG